MSPRPHDTGLVTLVSQELSEFVAGGTHAAMWDRETSLPADAQLPGEMTDSILLAARENAIVVVDAFTIDAPKTSVLKALVEKHKAAPTEEPAAPAPLYP